MIALSMTTPPAARFIPHLDRADVLSSSSITDSSHLSSLSGLSSATPSNKRPKLSLQTASLSTAPTYGVSLSTKNPVDFTSTAPLTAATPTTLNTFNNTYDLTFRPSPSSTTGSPAQVRLLPSRSSSPFAFAPKPAYNNLNLAYGIKPILKKGPSSDLRRSSICSSSTSSPRQRRVFFPAPKKVSFRPILEDEIVTKTYTARHLDLSPISDENGDDEEGGMSDASTSSSSSSSSPSSTSGSVKLPADLSPDDTTVSEGSHHRRHHLPTLNAVDESETLEVARGRSGGRSRNVPSSSHRSTKRNKRRRRRWEWTLEAAPPAAAASTSTVADAGLDVDDDAGETLNNDQPCNSEHQHGQPDVRLRVDAEFLEGEAEGRGHGEERGEEEEQAEDDDDDEELMHKSPSLSSSLISSMTSNSKPPETMQEATTPVSVTSLESTMEPPLAAAAPAPNDISELGLGLGLTANERENLRG